MSEYTEKERAKHALESGPAYPDLGAGVAKFRRLAVKAGSVMDMPKAERHAYADAIEKAIRAKHRTLHTRPTPPTTPGWYKPPSITRLLRYENPIKMQGDPMWLPDNARLRYSNEPNPNIDQWALREAAVYAHMMDEKRARIAPSLAPTVTESIFA